MLPSRRVAGADRPHRLAEAMQADCSPPPPPALAGFLEPIVRNRSAAFKKRGLRPRLRRHESAHAFRASLGAEVDGFVQVEEYDDSEGDSPRHSASRDVTSLRPIPSRHRRARSAAAPCPAARPRRVRSLHRPSASAADLDAGVGGAVTDDDGYRLSPAPSTHVPRRPLRPGGRAASSSSLRHTKLVAQAPTGVSQPADNQQQATVARTASKLTVLGEGVHFDGDLHFDNRLEVDGQCTGRLTSNGRGELRVGRGGKVVGSIVGAKTVVIDGVVDGDLMADNVTLGGGAVITGSISAGGTVVDSRLSTNLHKLSLLHTKLDSFRKLRPGARRRARRSAADAEGAPSRPAGTLPPIGSPRRNSVPAKLPRRSQSFQQDQPQSQLNSDDVGDEDGPASCQRHKLPGGTPGKLSLKQRVARQRVALLKRHLSMRVSG